MPGRTPKPTALLRVQGTFRPDRHAKRAQEPKPAPGAPLPPKWLMQEALAEWDRVLLAYGQEGILTCLDRAMLATFCQMWGRFVEAEAATPYVGLPASYLSVMAGIGSRLGLDPSGRTRLRNPGAEPNPDEAAWAKLRAIKPRPN